MGHTNKNSGYVVLLATQHQRGGRVRDQRRAGGQTNNPASLPSVFSTDYAGETDFLIFTYLLTNNNHKLMASAELKEIKQPLKRDKNSNTAPWKNKWNKWVMRGICSQDTWTRIPSRCWDRTVSGQVQISCSFQKYISSFWTNDYDYKSVSNNGKFYTMSRIGQMYQYIRKWAT